MLNMSRTLIVSTTYLHDSDRDAAKSLGDELYSLLTRPKDSPLAFGAGIPVYSAVAPDQVHAEKATINVLVPVLGAQAFFTQRKEVLEQLKRWHELMGSGCVITLPLVSQWRAVESELPGKQLLTELYGAGERRLKTFQEIVLALTRVLLPKEVPLQSPRLFISHAKADLVDTRAAEDIRDYVQTRSTGASFFDATSLLAGQPLADQLDTATSGGVLVAIQGDAYSSRSWCQRELISAKRNGVPTIVVSVLKNGEKRSSPYAGNSPTIVWHSDLKAEDQAGAILLQCMIEWLKATYFQREGERVRLCTNLPPEMTVITRPPELLDIAQGRVRTDGVVLYPDPELPVAEQLLLRNVYPRLQTVTPSTVYRLSSGGSAETMFLQGRQIAVSISDSPDVDGPFGFTAQHLQDTVLSVARTLIASGSQIAYGGDFRFGGYTERFSELVASYNDTMVDSVKFLQLYQPADTVLSEVPEGMLFELYQMKTPGRRTTRKTILTGVEGRDQKSVNMSDMRCHMAKSTDARILIGGKTSPRHECNPQGYSGIFPGVVEEAWWTLKARKPLYVIGGFGGAAKFVTDLLQTGKVPGDLKTTRWAQHQDFAELVKAVQNDSLFKKLRLPSSMEVMAKQIITYRKTFLKSDASAVKWNGLTKAENNLLWTTRDPLLIASLIQKGLVTKLRIVAKGKLKVELVQGSIAHADGLNAIAIPTFNDIPLGGAGLAIDRVTNGLASEAHRQKRDVVKLNTRTVSSDWLILASLGPSKQFDKKRMKEKVAELAKKVRQLAEERGFKRLGVVTFGGTVQNDQLATSAKAMLDELSTLGEDYTIVWFETNPEKYQTLNELLQGQKNVVLGTRRAAPDGARVPVRDEALILQVSLERQKLSVTLLPPSGSAIVTTRPVTLTPQRMAEFSRGGGRTERETPSMEELSERGRGITEMILGEDAEEFIRQCGQRRIVVVHDPASAQIPFELMNVPTPKNPRSINEAPDRKSRITKQMSTSPLAITHGISRRLIVDRARVDQLFGRVPKSGQINVLLIVNPTGDLKGTELEQRRIVKLLGSNRLIKLSVLKGPDATKTAVLEAFGQADVLHYCGHAFYDGPGESSSGLLLAPDKAGSAPATLTLQDLKSLENVPRMAFFNACEAARVRGVLPGADASRAFAEFMLRSGIEAFLGTYWQVSDFGAAEFASQVYERLSTGTTLDDAILHARKALYSPNGSDKNKESAGAPEPNPEWANYILYGNGAFRMLQPSY